MLNTSLTLAAAFVIGDGGCVWIRVEEGEGLPELETTRPNAGLWDVCLFVGVQLRPSQFQRDQDVFSK